MKILIVILNCVLLFSCFEQKKETTKTNTSVVTDTSHAVTNPPTDVTVNNVNELLEEAHKKNVNALDSIIYPIDEKLPFGSSVLTEYTFPENGFSDSSENNNSEKTDQEQFYKLIGFYTQLKTSTLR